MQMKDLDTSQARNITHQIHYLCAQPNHVLKHASERECVRHTEPKKTPVTDNYGDTNGRMYKL